MSVTKDFWETIPIFHLFIPFQFWPSTRHQVRQLHKENIRQHTKTLQIVPPYQTRINKTHLLLKKYKVHFPFQRGHYHCLLNFREVSEESTLQFYGCGKDNIDLLVCYWDGHLVVQRLWNLQLILLLSYNGQFSRGSRNWVSRKVWKYEIDKAAMGSHLFSFPLSFHKNQGIDINKYFHLVSNPRLRLHTLRAMYTHVYIANVIGTKLACPWYSRVVTQLLPHISFCDRRIFLSVHFLLFVLLGWFQLEHQIYFVPWETSTWKYLI